MASLGVTVAVIRAGDVLLVQREDSRFWCLPGGAVEAGESLAVAAVREVREETGLDVQLTRLVGVYSRPDWDGGGNHEMLFAAEPVGGTLKRATAESVDAGFFGPTNLPAPLLWWHRQRIEHTLTGAHGIAYTQHVAWPFPRGLTRTELYALRDRDPLHFARALMEWAREPRAEDGTLEVDGG
ncbi:MAG: NUDIX domain-containing protein [Chloroflexi bacterium]|nr:NUDIX domain-containing protein [Chloroflexota bacterium]